MLAPICSCLQQQKQQQSTAKTAAAIGQKKERAAVPEWQVGVCDNLL